jgi:hypothetical protein
MAVPAAIARSGSRRYGGRSFRYDRVSLKDGTIDIPFCAVSLLGCLQPDRFDSMLLSGDDDGLASRPLYAWPDPVRPRRPSRGADRHAILAALQRLRALVFDVDDGGIVQPRIMSRTPQTNSKHGGSISSGMRSWPPTGASLARLEFLDWAWCKSNTVEPEQVSVQSVRNAILLIDDWVRPNLESGFAEASLPQAQRDAMAVGRWLLKTRSNNINSRDLRRQSGFPDRRTPRNSTRRLRSSFMPGG